MLHSFVSVLIRYATKLMTPLDSKTKNQQNPAITSPILNSSNIRDRKLNQTDEKIE